MTDLTTRVRTALGGKPEANAFPWEMLIRLYSADRESFYQLAVGGPGGTTESELESLADFARRIRKAVRASYRSVIPGLPFLRSTRFSFYKASRRCRCGSTGSVTVRPRSHGTSNITTRLPGSITRAWKITRITGS